MDIDKFKIRADFPFFEKSNLIYVDNAATSQKPRQVIEAVSDYYIEHNANPYRGLYDLSEDATSRYEHARKRVAEFINAREPSEIIFTRNATESLNLLAYSLGEICVNEGDEIIVSIAEHHSNMLPFRMLAKRKGAKVIYLECNKDGSFDIEKFKGLLNEKTKIVSITGMSNVYGNITEVSSIVKLTHEKDAIFILDGAQFVPHSITDVQALDVDFLAFSGHKMLGPMGIGVLYGKKEILERMPPFLQGGEMIEYVTRDEVSYAPLPNKFEAGTVNVGGAIGLAAAIDYVDSIGMNNIVKAEEELTRFAMDEIKKNSYVEVIGSDDYRMHNGIITFRIKDVHPHDVSSICASLNIAIRAGHHCAGPLHDYIGISSTNRISLMFYNTEDEVKSVIDALTKIRKLMGFKE